MMFGKVTLLATALCCSFLLFANTCLAAIGGERHRKEDLGFTDEEEKAYSDLMLEKTTAANMPYEFKFIKPRKGAMKKVMEYFYEKHPSWAGKWLACEAGVLQEEDRNTFWLNLGPHPRSQCQRSSTRMQEYIVQHLDGKWEIIDGKDYPTLERDMIQGRRDAEGQWLNGIDPKTDPGGGPMYHRYLEYKEKQEQARAEADNDEL